ncbi:unnamed protein product, partial [Vitis vinifera]|uniref:TPX2 C-terminal domain-containing protein n=1 Tax=Vitis vinifera TaxID=29760 RepID=D7TDR0_VITVI
MMTFITLKEIKKEFFWKFEGDQNKSAIKKFVKASSHSAVPWSSTNREVVRYNIPPQQAFRSPSWVSQKPPTKENTKPVEFKLHTQQRALKRAMFNYSVATKLYFIEQQKKLEERVQKMIQEEEVKLLRKEMIPRAQLMPFFDRPFYPQRSNRPLTVPKEPCFHNLSSKCWSSGVDDFSAVSSYEAH